MLIICMFKLSMQSKLFIKYVATSDEFSCEYNCDEIEKWFSKLQCDSDEILSSSHYVHRCLVSLSQ